MHGGYVLDEHLRGPLWQAVLSHNAQGVYPIDTVRVGDLSELPCGTLDPVLLIWAQREDRILVSHDESTMKTHLADHLAAGQHSPGVFLVRRGSTLNEVIAFLVAARYASDPHEWQDQYFYIP